MKILLKNNKMDNILVILKQDFYFSTIIYIFYLCPWQSLSTPLTVPFGLKRALSSIIIIIIFPWKPYFKSKKMGESLLILK